MSVVRKIGLNALLVFIPVALTLEWTAPERPALIFLAAALGIIPLASLLVQATEQIALRTGDTIGGLLNATFGNAPELIIGFVALQSGFVDMVRAALIGAILANLLLGLGMAFFFGGIRRHTQEFSLSAARVQASMMLMAVISLMVPGGYHTLLTPENLHYERYLNTGIALVLLASYALSLVFMLRTHPEVFAAKEHHEETGQIRWALPTAVGVLVAASVGAAIMSEILVGSVEGASESLGMSKAFVGLIVLAIIGGAAELGSVVTMGLRDRMDLAMGIAFGSSIQIVLFVAPVLVLISIFAAPVPFTLAFGRGELTLLFMTVLIGTIVAGDGRSNWYKGIQLLTVYLIFAMLFFMIPGK